MSINGDLAESEYGDDYIEQEEEALSDSQSEKFDPKADKRAHHNALERKRRDHIKDSFSSLKNAVPTFNGEKSGASRAQILKKAAEYISVMRNKNIDHQRDIDCLKRENKILEEKIVRALEQMKSGGNSSAAVSLLEHIDDLNGDSNGDSEVPTVDDKPNSQNNTIRVKKNTQTASGQNSPSKRRKTSD